MYQYSYAKVLLLLLWIVGNSIGGQGQPQPQENYRPLDAGELQLALERLNTLGTALYIAAHPDDENTQLITYLTKHKQVRTGYLSITRGDGGQNLLGAEKGKVLGVLRTEELLSARHIDGGLQYFTRANDFGYSKTTHETLQIWDSTAVLSDMVWVIRKLRPDVIITRFPLEGFGTHGHHTASAELAKTAFQLAGDKEAFPQQLKYVDTWRPKRVLFNTSWWFYRDKEESMDSSALLKANVGIFNPLLGQSLTEIAGKSRSQHKTQGFGATQFKGQKWEFLDHMAGDKAEEEIFEGVDLSWSRVKGGQAVKKHITKAQRKFDPEAPHKIVPHLVNAYEALQQVENDYWKKVKRKQLKHVIAAAAGLWFEVTANDYSASPGTKVPLTVTSVNRSPADVSLENIHWPFGNREEKLSQQLRFNKRYQVNDTMIIPSDEDYTHPYWLKAPPASKGMYTVSRQKLRGLPVAPHPTRTHLTYTIEGQSLTFIEPIRYRWEDPVQGDSYRPFEISPPVMVNREEKVYVFSNDKPQEVRFSVRAGQDSVKAMLSLKLPGEWEAEPSQTSVQLDKKGRVTEKKFMLYPPSEKSVNKLTPQLQFEGHTYQRGRIHINYDHVEQQTMYPVTRAKLVRLNVKTKGKKVGYIPGTGDEIPASLRQIGYEVVTLTSKNFSSENLSSFDAIVTGVRAYNTNSNMKNWHDELMQYVKEGGTMVAQYSKSFGLVTSEIGPYSLHLSHDRVTDETAPMKMLDADHPLLNKPNDINEDDFKNWVQERGLYFPDKWDDRYKPLFSSHDPGEKPTRGALLVANHGEGAFIYTGLSFFRQLPAGVPGAYQLFANLISYNN